MSYSPGTTTPQGQGARMNTMLMISLAIHILILSSGAFLQISPTPRMTFGPVYSVQLVNMPAAVMESRPSSSLSKDLLIDSSRERAVILRQQSDALSKIPIRKMENPIIKSPQLEQALEQIRKKAAKESPAAVQPGGQPQGQQAPAGENTPLNDYYRTIWSKIKSQWALPGGILPKGNLEALVHVRIMRNGSLTDIGIERRSGNTYFDNSALRAVNKANPLPHLPEWFRGNSLDVGIRFHSSELH